MCGIIGIYNHNHAAELAALGLFAEQHRGQESCGIAVCDGKVFQLKKSMGLVKDVFTQDALKKMEGNIAVGHVRYPTRGSSTAFNSQPHIVETLAGPSYALASNGDITNYYEMRGKLEAKGVYFASNNDGELILKYIIYYVEKENFSIVEAIQSLMKNVFGAYSTVLATRNELYMFRDPYGFRPMVWGKLLDNSVAVASESCALDILDAQQVQAVKPAEIIIVNQKGLRQIENEPTTYRKTEESRHCIFEFIYFSRPDSHEFSEDVYDVREKIGKLLAEQDEDLQPDLVVPVPDSSNFIAIGYAKHKGLPTEFGLIRNHYVGRTFIKPDQGIRDESVRQKFNVLPHFFKDKKVVLIDDSIVRGTTIKNIIKLIKDAGASEVHLRIGSPQVKFSCFYGIDTPTQEELIANRKTIEQICEFLDIKSIKHIPLDDLKKSVSKPTHFCYACFNGQYPI